MQLPTYFISHGGGPWPYMQHLRRQMKHLEHSLAKIPRELGVVPRAILVVSGHWEEHAFTVMAHPRPPMFYDYSGFPPHTYQVTYAAPGDPALAQRVHDLIAAAGLPAALDRGRGFDHGTFAPLAVMYPDAQVPVLQLSLLHGLAPEAHFLLGRALAPLRDEGVLILGSGVSYHNLSQLGPPAKAPSLAFDGWLQEVVIGVSGEARRQHLMEWTSAPAARIAHPREDHLIPLMVAAGAAEAGVAKCVYHEDDVFGGATVSSFRFGALAVGP